MRRIAFVTGDMGGKLYLGSKRETPNGPEYSKHEYAAYGDARVSASEIRGGINKLLEEIPERTRKHQVYDSWMPNVVSRNFENVDEAVDFIGYEKIFFPKLNYPCEGITVVATGVPKDDSIPFERVSDDEEYLLGEVSMNAIQRYHSDPDYWFETMTHIFTEHSASDKNAVTMGYSNKAEFSAEERKVGERTFSILYEEDPHFYEGYRKKIEVFWQERGVFYMFHIVYGEELCEEAERIAQKWMESFP